MAEPLGWFDGKPGDSLFHSPFMSMFRENPLPDLFRKLEVINDDRLTGIVTALIVEDRIDHLLTKFLPRYKQFADEEKCSFSMKIRLVEALNFIPPRITAMADCLRQVRNEFAHDLTKTAFEHLPQKILNRLASLRNDVCLYSDGPAPSISHAFNNLRFFCVVSLDIYGVNVQALREAISDPDFLEGLQRTIRERGEAQRKEIVSMPPISVEHQGIATVTRYEGGVVDVKLYDSGELHL